MRMKVAFFLLLCIPSGAGASYPGLLPAEAAGGGEPSACVCEPQTTRECEEHFRLL